MGLRDTLSQRIIDRTPQHRVFEGTRLSAKVQNQILEKHAYLSPPYDQQTSICEAIETVVNALSSLSDKELERFSSVSQDGKTTHRITRDDIEHLKDTDFSLFKHSFEPDGLYAAVVSDTNSRAYILFNQHVEDLPQSHINKIMAHEITHYLKFSEGRERLMQGLDIFAQTFGNPLRVDNYARMVQQGGVVGALAAGTLFLAGSHARIKRGAIARDQEHYADFVADTLFPQPSMREVLGVEKGQETGDVWRKNLDRVLNTLLGKSHPLEEDRAAASDSRAGESALPPLEAGHLKDINERQQSQGKQV